MSCELNFVYISFALSLPKFEQIFFYFQTDNGTLIFNLNTPSIDEYNTDAVGEIHSDTLLPTSPQPAATSPQPEPTPLQPVYTPPQAVPTHPESVSTELDSLLFESPVGRTLNGKATLNEVSRTKVIQIVGDQTTS